MVLQRYRQKRDFERTPEPSGGGTADSPGRRFVVQKHAARRLHYDLRLEMDGVLKSWAVPKGPSMDPSEKRLAVHVEDHPLDYVDFEGVIPPGQYGAGTVEVWDRGTWVPEDNPGEGYSAGKFAFTLRGAKLVGRWALVHMRARDGDAKNWLLIKEKDEHVRTGTQDDVLTARPESVLSGRTLEEIFAQQQGGDDDGTSSELGARLPDPAGLSGARPGSMPDWIEPQLATLSREAPAGVDWLHEIKFDGYRILAYRVGDSVRMLSRRQGDWTTKFAAIARAVAALPVREVVLDGEVVVLEPDGRSSFAALQGALRESRDADLVYHVFDVLHLDATDLTGVGLMHRKDLLRQLLAAATADGRLRYTDHIEGKGPAFHRQACSFALEGVVSKRADRAHRAGRTGDWRKVKCLERQEFVIAGFTEPSGSRRGFGALLLGVYQDGDLVYAGRVGTGFTERALDELRRRLDALEQPIPAFAETPSTRGMPRVHWVKPEVVAEVRFANWTHDGLLRQPAFVGLREDKPARDVVRERPADATASPRRVVRQPRKETVEVAEVALSNPQRLYYPEDGITKRDLASFYERIAGWVLPHVTGRPLALVRCPEGYEKKCFFQKQATEDLPRSILRVPLEVEGEKVEYVAINSLPGLVSLVQLGALELHTWSARADDVERPDRIVIDLDPDPQLPLTDILRAATLVRTRVESLGLVPFVKTSGGKGYHIVVPLVRRHTWDDVAVFARALAADVAHEAPDLCTATMSKAKRTNKVYLDWVRSTRGATTIAAYCVRARRGAPVSVPIAWQELRQGVRPDAYTFDNLPHRLAALRADPWDGYGLVRQSISRTAKRQLQVT